MTDQTDTLFVPGETCWRVERADRLALIVDAADYFVALREALREAREEVLMIGWDFDFEIDMLPGQSDDDGLAPDGLPNKLGEFLTAIVERTETLDLYMLKWNGAVLAAPGRILPSAAMAAFSDERIRFALDGHHPFGACHHQKIVVIDDVLAFCGGIDATEERWDTRDHTPDDPLRTDVDGDLLPPWHDATTALLGPVAGALGELSRTRWLRATGDTIDPPHAAGNARALWPDHVGDRGLPVMVRDVDVAIMRTEPPYDGEPMVDEIERNMLAAIRAAGDVIYAESQYLCADSVVDAMAERLREPDGPEIVVLNPQAARGGVEDAAMHSLRARAIHQLRAADAHDRFRAFYPVNAAGEPIYVHAKITTVDERLMRIGSSNIDDRSMGFDTECDIGFEGTHEGARAAVRDLRLSLLAEHMDTDPHIVDEAWRRKGSLVAAIAAINPERGRRLVSIEPKPETLADTVLANTRLFDQRFYPGEETDAGEGLRPRHIAIAAGIGLAAAAGWYAWSRLAERDAA